MSVGLPVGIDGCPGGWVWVARLGTRWAGGVAARLSELPADLRLADDGGPQWRAAQHGRPLAASDAADLGPALIDMPIGLLSGGKSERDCDRAARALLGRPRGSSVFRAPARSVLGAADYPAACALNRAQTGVALAKQTWHLVTKIRELDACLRALPQPRLAEAHPELCLWGLAGGRAMRHAKRTPAGRAERLALLGQLAPELPGLIHRLCAAHPRRLLAPDDAIDAATLALTAALLGQLQSGARPAAAQVLALPTAAQFDDTGLPMRIWCVRRTAPGAAVPDRAARLQV